jgi:hypothetical protein
MTIVGGAGSLSASGKAAWNAAAGSIRGGGGFALAFTSVIDCVAWWDEYSQGKKDFVDLAVTVELEVVKAGMSAAATSAVVAIITIWAAAAFTFVSPIFAIAIGTVLIMGIVGYYVDKAFQSLQVDEHLNTQIRELGRSLEAGAPKDYADTYSQSAWHINGLGVGF